MPGATAVIATAIVCNLQDAVQTPLDWRQRGSAAQWPCRAIGIPPRCRSDPSKGAGPCRSQGDPSPCVTGSDQLSQTYD
ncbi:hypothetical protein ACOMHN_051945 [Nucella lapillus]